jgi:serine/threonine protein phosphatase 1
MLNKLFAGGDRASAPAGERIYAVGDIHGCAAMLREMLSKIAADSAGAKARLVFLGDYVDRGPDSRAVVDLLVALRAERPDTVFLKGNHERAMLDFIADPELNEEWLHWGGDKTLESYGVDDVWMRDPRKIAQELREKLPAAHRAFLESLELWRAFGDYLFVHAGFRPGVPLAEQKEEDCLWIRGEFHNAPPDLRPSEVVVHGHHPVRRPHDAGWRINVDTGAVWSGALTAVALEGTSRRFLTT